MRVITKLRHENLKTWLHGWAFVKFFPEDRKLDQILVGDEDFSTKNYVNWSKREESKDNSHCSQIWEIGTSRNIKPDKIQLKGRGLLLWNMETFQSGRNIKWIESFRDFFFIKKERKASPSTYLRQKNGTKIKWIEIMIKYDGHMLYQAIM